MKYYFKKTKNLSKRTLKQAKKFLNNELNKINSFCLYSLNEQGTILLKSNMRV